MAPPLRALDQCLGRLSRAGILALAAGGAVIVGGIDYLTGYEVSISLFYLGPVAVAAWYAGRPPGIGIAVLACLCWYVAELAAGGRYSHAAIPVWNALVRFGFFLITALLLTALRQSLRGQQQLARMDGLTGLHGRRAFDERLAHDLALAQRRKSALTLAYIDLDDFKAVNDTYGHAAGDRLLKAVAGALSGSIREADTAARIGGDEFAPLLPNTDGRAAELVVAKIRRALHDALGAERRDAACSIGVVTFLGSAISPERAVAAADELMYRVKRGSKGSVAFSTLGEDAVRRDAAATRQAPSDGASGW
jgi:diguanylate cyclase (GGDEF)-like protein